MSDRLRLPALAVAIALVATGAFTLFRANEPKPLFVFPDDGQTWIAVHSVSRALDGTPIVRFPWGSVTLTAPNGPVETVEITPGAVGPFVVTVTGPVKLCFDGSHTGLCRDLVIEHGTLYEFWSDTDEVFTTKQPTVLRIRDGGCIGDPSC